MTNLQPTTKLSPRLDQILKLRRGSELGILRVDIENLAVLNDFEASDLARIAAFLPPKFHAVEDFTQSFITGDPRMKEILGDLNILAYTNDPILLRGPTGVGKEVLARCLMPYREGEFIGYNCATLTSTLAESILFGHKKGSFTGAFSDSPGLFEQAENGLLFLDEIFELDRVLQAKLLRVLQEQKYRPLGAKEEQPVKCRMVFASCQEKPDARLDFLARISTFEFHIPALKDRPGDAQLIMEKISPGFPPDKIDPSHPNNVRQLQRQARQMEILGKLL